MRELVEARRWSTGHGGRTRPHIRPIVSGEQVLLVGAASFVDPLSSFGVKKALASAWLASVVVHTALLDRSMVGPATQLFAERERALSTTCSVSRELSREAAARMTVGSGMDARMQRTSKPTTTSMWRRCAPTRVSPLSRISRASVVPAGRRSLTIVERAAVRGHQISLQQHLASPVVPGVRYCRNIDLVLVTQLAGQYDQVPDLSAYNPPRPPHHCRFLRRFRRSSR
jgi:hypothetical protein